ncbi:MAG: hypothetical protein K2J88_07420 [Oscillospiraceae bacterium]|nr:hypothetical protein [Oscillospiraceae bacterium]
MAMKKPILVFIIFLISTIDILAIILLSCSKKKTHIQTDYNDSFTAVTGLLSDGDGKIIDNSSDFCEILNNAWISKENVIPICDTKYFRCYQLKTSKDNFYICKFKPDGKFFTIYAISYFSDAEHIKEWYDEDLKNIFSIFLADKYVMQVFLPYLNICYPDQIIAIAEKFVAKDFDSLEKYGLTDSMRNDIADLNEKIVIMNEYLQSQRNNLGGSLWKNQ